jgi:cyanophycin synthetase
MGQPAALLSDAPVKPIDVIQIAFGVWVELSGPPDMAVADSALEGLRPVSPAFQRREPPRSPALTLAVGPCEDTCCAIPDGVQLGAAMELVEIRDLDGPNVFLLAPAIKIELRVGRRDLSREAVSRLRGRLDQFGVADESTAGGVGALGELLAEVVRHLHRANGAVEPDLTWRELETAGHVALAFTWERRRFAIEIARLAADLALGDVPDLAERTTTIARLAKERPVPGDQPEFVRDAQRTIPIIGVTGTNGKTTTTRLCAHVLRSTGRRVGWTTTAGVFIDGECVLAGDYTGPQGAHRVLGEPGLDAAILETARGGILLRGLAYESNDVGVFLNVSPDHLGLLGIHSVDGLAQVKATVVRVTKPGGRVVLNADDPLVRGVAGSARAPVLYVSRDPESPTIRNHVSAGGSALVVDRGAIVLVRDGARQRVIDLTDVPITFAGRATHMVENTLCAAAACLAFGLTEQQVAAGLASFRNSPELNRGRLNVFDVDGATVIVDYAHNEAGLEGLLNLARTLVRDDGRLVAVIGSAGDRTDDALRGLGRIAGEMSDEVVIKETQRYLRGRATATEMSRLMLDGVAATHGTAHVEPTELDGLKAALVGRNPGDVVALMCIEQLDDVLAMLVERGRLVS